MALPKTAPVFLESGDRLTRAEFHRRYCARPDIKRAELIEGVVYVPSPTRLTWHDEQTAWMIGWAVAYAARHPGVRAGSSSTIFLSDDTEVQPDAFLFRPVPVGEGPSITERGYIDGQPQLIVEVAASSVSYDLHDKMRAYRRAGVREYVIWRVLDEAIDWFVLRDSEYLRLEPDEHGVVESAVFPGLRLNVPKMLAGDTAGVLAELDR